MFPENFYKKVFGESFQNNFRSIHFFIEPEIKSPCGRFCYSELFNSTSIEILLPENPIEFTSVVLVILHELLHNYLYSHNLPFHDTDTYFLECCEILEIPDQITFRIPSFFLYKDAEEWVENIFEKMKRRGQKEEMITIK